MAKGMFLSYIRNTLATNRAKGLCFLKKDMHLNSSFVIPKKKGHTSDST